MWVVEVRPLVLQLRVVLREPRPNSCYPSENVRTDGFVSCRTSSWTGLEDLRELVWVGPVDPGGLAWAIRPAHRGCYTPSVIRRDNSICVSTERRDVAKSLITLELTAPEDCACDYLSDMILKKTQGRVLRRRTRSPGNYWTISHRTYGF